MELELSWLDFFEGQSETLPLYDLRLAALLLFTERPECEEVDDDARGMDNADVGIKYDDGRGTDNVDIGIKKDDAGGGINNADVGIKGDDGRGTDNADLGIEDDTGGGMDNVKLKY